MPPDAPVKKTRKPRTSKRRAAGGK
jgi:hypothetical protein